MTYPGDGHNGWGGQSGQGDWGQQPNEPYGYPASGEHPTAGGYPATGGFPQQSAGYGGLGVFSPDPEPEPPRKSKRSLWIALSALGVALVVGAVVVIVVLNNKNTDQPVAQSSSSATAPASRPNTDASTDQSSAPTAPSASTGKQLVDVAPVVPGWTVVATPATELAYDIPSGWVSRAGGKIKIDSMQSVSMIGVSEYGNYNCQGSGYGRSGAAVVRVPTGDPTTVANAWAKALGEQFYQVGGAKIDLKLGAPKPIKRQFQDPRNSIDKQIDGVEVDAIITTTGNQCLATKGEVKIVVLTTNQDLVVFMDNGDLEGGPATPAPTTEADLQKIADSARPVPVK
ncbi:hypothetical protein F0L68_22300 [Solihabitans fulvus]|uniref:DUF8017 domain-containing protein n=1 Tax=Solihabitans fulvus TaxID=1892852 RepID=A0A5B2X5D9_9PSEU|nr:hypothetical protein [Solihabitans fulvus]KAA2258588.1 hypothetical protein F0L68_22300 [Solihabitans fulvus]